MIVTFVQVIYFDFDLEKKVEKITHRVLSVDYRLYYRNSSRLSVLKVYDVAIQFNKKLYVGVD